MTQTVDDALRAMRLYSDNLNYWIVHLPAQAITAAAGVLAEAGTPLLALIADKDEVTLVIETETFADVAHRLPGHTLTDTPYRLITLDITLEPTLTGFMARVSAALAAVGIPIIPLGAFSRDHLLVPQAQFTTALSTLERLQSALQ